MKKSEYPLNEYRYCSKCIVKFPKQTRSWCAIKSRAPGTLASCSEFREKWFDKKRLRHRQKTIDDWLYDKK